MSGGCTCSSACSADGASDKLTYAIDGPKNRGLLTRESFHCSARTPASTLHYVYTKPSASLILKTLSPSQCFACVGTDGGHALRPCSLISWACCCTAQTCRQAARSGRVPASGVGCTLMLGAASPSTSITTACSPLPHRHQQPHAPSNRIWSKARAKSRIWAKRVRTVTTMTAAHGHHAEGL